MKGLEETPPRTPGAVHVLVAIIALAAVLLVLQLCSKPASAFTPPPSTGDWVINDTTSWNSGAVIAGNIRIGPGGALILDGANITMNCMQKCQYAVDIQGGGTLRASNTVFSARTSSLPYMFKIRTGANVLVDRCTIMDVGAFTSSMDSWGIYVHSSNTTITNSRITRCNVGLLVHGFVSPTISGNSISNNSDRGIWCKFSSPVISGNRFSGNGYGIYIENDSFPEMLDNEFSDNSKDAVWMAPGCVAGWTIAGRCAWVNSTLNFRGNITIAGGGLLWLQESVLGMATVHGGLAVGAGGELRLRGSTLQADGGSDAYYLVVEAGGSLAADASLIKNAGWPGAGANHTGIFVAGNARITGCSLMWNNISLVVDHGTVAAFNSTLGGGALDIMLNESSVRLVNVSFSRSRVSMAGQSSALEVAWHLSAGAVWQNGRGVQGASLSVRTAAGASIYEGVPDGGWVRYLVVTGQRITPSGSTDTANVTILARKQGFEDITRTLLLSADREERLVFTDSQPPSSSISAPADGWATNRTSVQASGACSDANGLLAAEYSLDDFPRWTALFPGQEAPMAGGDWAVNITNLTRGNHRLSVRVIDVAGTTAFSNISFLVDDEPPELELDEPFEQSVVVNRSGVRFRGTAEPGSRIFVGTVEVAESPDGSFDAVVNLSEGQNTVQVFCRDRAQNTASLARTVTVDLTPPLITVFSPTDGYRTRNAEIQLAGRIEPGARFRVDGSTVILGPDGSFDVTISLTGGPKTVELYAEDAASNGNTTQMTITRIIDTQAGGGGLMEKYGLYIALGLVALIVAAAAGAVLVRRRGRGRPPATGGGPAPAAQGGTVLEAIEVVEADK